MLRRVRTLLFVSALTASLSLAAQTSQPLALSFNLTPYYSLPLDQLSDAAQPKPMYNFGMGTRASVDYIFPRLPFLSVGMLGDLQYLQTQNPDLGLVTLGLGAQSAVNVKVLPSLSLVASGAAGGYTLRRAQGPSDLFTFSGFQGREPWVSAGLGLGLNVGDVFSLNASANYQVNFASRSVGSTTDTTWELAHGPTFSLSANFMPAGNAPFILDTTVPKGFTPLVREKKGLKLIGLKTDRIFPVFKNHYDDNAVGQVVLHNYDAAEAQNITVSAVVKDYMNGARDLKVPATLAGGNTVTLDVFTLLNDRILTVAETTKLTLSLTVKYRQNGQDVVETYDPTIESLYRNAITWDDDQHVAAFISARDPAAYGFIRGVVALTRDLRNRALSNNLQTAIVLHEALKQHGLIYSKVPSSAFNKGDKVAVDTVQFPQETLQSKTGDCSDLTVLWCSLLESVGIETAALTTPGHIYMAFALDITSEQAVAVLGSRDKFLFKNGKAWVPVETTMITDSFMNAWKEGARESDPVLQPNLAFYPIHEAWKNYAPVVVSGTASTPPLPQAAVLEAALNANLASLFKSELEPRVAKLQSDIQAAGKNAAKPTSNLAFLYAKYGVYDKAAQILADLTSKQSYGPAFVNLGNVYLLQKKYQEAVTTFEAWLNINPDEALAVAGQALSYDGLGDTANAQSAMARLQTLDKKLADRYSYLNAAETSSNGGRAAEAGQLESILGWKE